MAKKEQKQRTYRVNLTCTYNGYMNVRASSEDEAFQLANEMLNCETLSDFPDDVELPNGKFSFGEATADYIDEVYDDDDTDNVSPDNDNVSDQCASGVVREYGVMFCDEGIFGDDEEHEYDVDCADGVAVATAKNESDPTTLLLTYPKMEEAVTNEEFLYDVREYRGLPYDEKIHYGDIMMYIGKIVAKID